MLPASRAAAAAVGGCAGAGGGERSNPDPARSSYCHLHQPLISQRPCLRPHSFIETLCSPTVAVVVMEGVRLAPPPLRMDVLFLCFAVDQ